MLENVTGSHTSARQTLTDYLEEPGFEAFLETALQHNHSGTHNLLTVTFPVENIDPLACLELLDDGKSFQYYWENPQNDLALSAGESVVRLGAEGSNRFEAISRKMESIKEQSHEYAFVPHSHSGLHFLGGFSFFDEIRHPAWEAFGQASFSVPRWLIIQEGNLTLLTLTLKTDGFSDPAGVKSTLSEQLLSLSERFELTGDKASETGSKERRFAADLLEDNAYRRWTRAVNRATEMISERKFEKIVLARESVIRLKSDTEPTRIINTLRQQYPNCYTFLMRQEDAGTFLGCSPERLLSFHKNYLLTEALAGSIRRGSTATEDAMMEKELLQSSKDADEHRFVIMAVEKALSPFVKKIERGTKPVIKKMANVQHLFTPVTGWLKEQVDPLRVIKSLHPTPAVGGYPWNDAAPYIQQLEDFDRGWYAGPVGWLNTKGIGEFTVAIRSGLIEKEKEQVRFYAGCGIVADSRPDSEWRETKLKMTPMLSALQYD